MIFNSDKKTIEEKIKGIEDWISDFQKTTWLENLTFKNQERLDAIEKHLNIQPRKPLWKKLLIFIRRKQK